MVGHWDKTCDQADLRELIVDQMILCKNNNTFGFIHIQVVLYIIKEAVHT